MEEAGRIRRGYFVDGLGAAQFALAGRPRPPAGRARRRATTGPSAMPTCSPRRIRPIRSVPRCPGRDAARRIGGRSSARPVRMSPSSTAPPRCTSSVAARRSRRSPRPTTRPCWRPRCEPSPTLVQDGRVRELVIRKVDGRPSARRRPRDALLAAGFAPGLSRPDPARRAADPDARGRHAPSDGRRPAAVPGRPDRDGGPGERTGPGAPGPSARRPGDHRGRRRSARTCSSGSRAASSSGPTCG